MHVLLDSLLFILSLQNIIFMVIGVFIGIVFGAIPGLTGAIAIVVLLPLTFSMSNPMAGILFLLGIYNGSTYGGSISAILIGTPGTGGAAATVVDGHALARKGQPNKALKAALYASVFGGIFGSVLLLVASPLLSKAAIHLGPPEYFAVALLGIAIISGVGGSNPLTGFISASLGLLCSVVGMNPLSGVTRFAFDRVELMGGLGNLPVLLGIFALTLVLRGIMSQDSIYNKETFAKQADDIFHVSDFFKSIKTMIKSSFIGSFIGAVPGAGISIASFLAYTEAKRSSKHPQTFGKGELQGIIAPESSNNAVCASAFIPLLTLGIPGNVVSSILLGALTLQGIIPGPLMIENQAQYFYGIIFGFIVIQFFLLLEGRYLLRLFKKIINIPNTLLLPILVVFCIIGSFSFQQRVFDIGILIGFGYLYYWLQKFGASGAPFILGFILGPIIEFNLDGSFVMGNGSLLIFITRPVCLTFIIISVLLFVVMYHQNKKIEQFAQDAEEE